MLPEVETYFANRNAATNTYDAERQAQRENPVPMWRDDMTLEERRAFYDAESKQQAAILKIRQEARERQATAEDGLRNSDNPLVAWMVNHQDIWGNYRGHAHDVLRALPMTREEMEEFGDGHDWCGVYRQFLRMADEAGVLPEEDPNAIDISPLVEALDNEFGYGTRSLATVKRVIRQHLPEILEQVKQRETASA